MPATKASTFTFTVVLAGVRQLTKKMADALFEAGCDDATPSSSNGVVVVDFDREADSLGDAVKSALRDVQAAGYGVARIEFRS